MKAVSIRLLSHWGDLIGLKMKQILLLDSKVFFTTRDPMKTLLVPERPTTIVFEPLEAPSAGFGLGGLQRLKNSLMLAFLEPVVFSQRVKKL